MLKRVMTITTAVAVAALTALGGVAFAQRGASAHRIKAVTHKTAVHHKASTRKAAAEGVAESQESANEAPDSASEEGTSDGPGGHEDAPGAEVDHQFEGEEYDRRTKPARAIPPDVP